MIIKTESIIETLEIVLNKEISKININDLDNITYLRISKTSIDDILIVDSSDLQHFHNLKELSIENCMIDFKFIENLKKIKNIAKISFIHCDFIDDTKDYFEKLSINELVLNDVIGLDNTFFSNIKHLTIINCSFNCITENIDTLDISRSPDINIDFKNSYIKVLVINEKQYINNSYPKCKIIIKNKYDEVIKEISND